MIKSIEALEKLNYKISRISEISLKSKRRYAYKCDDVFLECVKCDLFKSLDNYHYNATGFKNRGSYCKECTNNNNSAESLAPSRHMRYMIEKNNNLLAFRVSKAECKYVIEYTIGNSFVWKLANNKFYNNLFEARNDINTNLTNSIEMSIK